MTHTPTGTTPRANTLTWTRHDDGGWLCGQPGDYRVRAHRHAGGGINCNIGKIYGYTVYQYVDGQLIDIGEAKNAAKAKAIAERHAVKTDGGVP